MEVGRDAGGRRIRQLRGGFATKAQAEHAQQELLSSLRNGGFVPASNVTLGRFLVEEWLPATAPPRVKHETWLDRQGNLERHVIPQLGPVPLQSLNSGHLNRLYADLLSTGRVDGRGGLSPTSVRRIHAILRTALNDATRWGRVQRNVVPLADPPSIRLTQAARRRSMRTWTEAELRQFLHATADHPLSTMWLFAATTGVRRSELLGLRWVDTDLRRRTAAIRQTVVASADGYVPQQEQKTRSSARLIHLDAHTAAALDAQRQLVQAWQGAVGPQWRDHDLVFPRQDGSWWNPPAISLAFRRAVRRAGAPPIRLHDLRHTHATLLLAAGVNAKVVSERLGHSSVSFTLDTYAHVMPGMQPEVAQLFIDRVLGDGTDPGTGRMSSQGIRRGSA